MGVFDVDDVEKGQTINSDLRQRANSIENNQSNQIDGSISPLTQQIISQNATTTIKNLTNAQPQSIFPSIEVNFNPLQEDHDQERTDKMDQSMISKKKLYFNQHNIQKENLQTAESGKKIRRQSTNLEKEAKFTDFSNDRTAAENMKSYIDNFGIRFELPSVYVLNAKFYPSNCVYSLQLVKYVFPISKSQKVVSHYNDGLVEVSHLQDIFAGYKKGIVLRMLIRSHTSMKKVDDMQFDSDKALIEFHPDGDYFAIFLVETQTIKICKVNKDQIQHFIDKLKKLENPADDAKYQVTYQGQKGTNKDLSFIENIKFDKNKRFLVGYGDNKIFVLDFKNPQHSIIYQNNERIYECICHLQFVSASPVAYMCYISCRAKGIKQICTFDLMEDIEYREIEKTIYHKRKLKSMATINFQQKIAQNFNVKLSDDLKQVILANGNENCVLDIYEDGQYKQTKLTQLKSKQILHIEYDHERGGFYMLASQQYDKYLSVEHTMRQDMSVRFNKSIEPGIIKIFDFHIQTDLSKRYENITIQPKEIRILSLKDTEFMLDKCSYDDCQMEDDNNIITMLPQINKEFKFVQKNEEYFNYIFSPLRAFSMCWPFIAFSGLGNFILLINANENTQIRRIQIADENQSITICQTYITETNDLFVCIQDEDTYKLYMIDLDYSILNEFREDFGEGEMEPYTFKLILQYNDTKVNLQMLNQMHIRGCSRKEQVDLNQSLQVFLVHGHEIYKWVQIKDSQEVVKVCRTTSKLMPSSDNTFYFSEINKDRESKQVSKQEIKVINVLFSNHELQTVYAEKSQTEKLKTFNIDQTENKLIILSKISSSREATMKNLFMFKIFDLDSRTILYESDLHFQELIGRLKSGLYAFVNGHIYYNNNVIKIRYDLINENQSVQLLENQIFDYYFNCFQLQEGERVCADTPLDSIRGHRFAYILQDQNQIKAKSLFILPYLHERRIYMNQKKQQSEYFFTTIETNQNEVKEYNTKLISQVTKKTNIINKIPVVERNLLDEIGNKMLDQLGISMIQSVEQMKFQLDQLSFTSILCVDLTKCMFEVYTQNSLLINQVDFSHLVQRFGQPVATSNNGQIWVFKKSLEQLEDLKFEGQSNEELMRDFMTFNIMKLNIFSFQLIKKLNFSKSFGQFFKSNGGKQCKDEFYDQNPWLKKTQSYDRDFHNKIDFQFVINDVMDFMVRIRNNSDFDEGKHYLSNEETESNIIFYYESNKKFLTPLVSQPNPIEECLQGLYQSKNIRETDFTMNHDYFIIWDKHQIRTLNLKRNNFCEENFKIVKFDIDPKDLGSFVKEVRTGSDPNHVLLIVNQSQEADTILSWDLELNIENDAFDIEEDYIIIWDSKGAPYILTEQKAIFIGERCAITAYDYRDHMADFNKQQLQKFKGHRLDSKNHNWLVLDEFLSLPFSYMTFVIKDKIENNDPLQNGNSFDIEPYNYIFNKSTCFIEGDFVVENYRLLERVLKDLIKIHPSHIEILQYTQNINQDDGQVQKNSALHKAEKAGNQRSIDILLLFMSQINFNASRNFMSILPDLIDMHCFADYFKCLPVQTNQMSKKQILKVASPLNDRIIAITSSPTVYVDQQFFTDCMGEKQTNQSYPVNVVGFRIGWILREPVGKKFLFSILNQNNLDLYKIETLQLIVEFLFQKIKIIIFTVFAPLYLISHITYENLITHQNHFYTSLWQERENGFVQCSSKAIEEKKVLDLWAILNFVAMSFQMMQIIVQIYSSKTAYFMKMYSYLDMIYIIQNIVTYNSVYIHFSHDMDEDEFVNKVKMQRMVACIGTITLYCKASYFLALVDQIAPLIDIIVKIFYDIKWFMLVLIIYLVMLGNCYTIMAQTQLDFYPTDDTKMQAKIEAYGEKYASYWYVSNFIIGNTDTSTFSVGDSQTEFVLKCIFVTTSFVICLHFLNMLIAIMGNSFGVRTEVGAQIMVRDHLRFVMDNWILLDVAFTDRSSINYIIAALSENEDQDQEGIITMLASNQNELKKMHKDVQDQFKKNFILTRDLSYNVGDILRRQQRQQNQS